MIYCKPGSPMPLLGGVDSAERATSWACARREAMAYIHPEITHNAAIFPDAHILQRLRI